MSNNDADWFAPIAGGEFILLGRDSPLRRIPINVPPNQALFLDGMRHAVEMIDVAFRRLREGLSKLALAPPSPADLPLITAGTFIDAWAVIDGIDKFRMLYPAMPGMTLRAPSAAVAPLQEVLQPFRDLRNIGQHVSQRSEFVLSTGSAAIGELEWLTIAQLEPAMIAFHCTLRPGTLRAAPELPTEPITSTLDMPTDFICLKAGGYRGNLSTVRVHIAGRVRHLEASLTEQFSKPQFVDAPVINDFFGRRSMKRAP